jgi:hypothetical protein
MTGHTTGELALRNGTFFNVTSLLFWTTLSIAHGMANDQPECVVYCRRRHCVLLQMQHHKLNTRTFQKCYYRLGNPHSALGCSSAHLKEAIDTLPLLRAWQSDLAEKH